MSVNTEKNPSDQEAIKKGCKANIASLTEHALGLSAFGLVIEGVGYAFNDPVMYVVGAFVTAGGLICAYDRQKAVTEYKNDYTPK